MYIVDGPCLVCGNVEGHSNLPCPTLTERHPMELTDCKTVDEVALYFAETYAYMWGLTEADIPDAKQVASDSLQHIAKLEYQRGLLRGAEWGIEVSAHIAAPWATPEQIQHGQGGPVAAIRAINPATVIAKEVE